MENLLKWSLEAETNPGEGPRTKLDENALSQLLGGADDAQLMTEAVKAAVDEKIPVEQKETALDNLEMLVENLDNAKLMEPLGLWHPLIKELRNNETHDAVKKMICWVFGTAVQNNEQAQNDLVQKESAVETLIECVYSKDAELAMKSLYALSSLLGHCQEAYIHFKRHDGWKMLEYTLDPGKVTIKVSLKALSIVIALSDIDPKDEKFKEFRNYKIIENVFKILDGPEYIHAHEKGLRAIVTLDENGFQLSSQEKTELKKHRDEMIKQGKIEKDEIMISE